MKKWSLLIAAFLFYSCTDDVITNSPGYEDESTENEIKITVQVPQASTPKTYAALSEQEENTIDHLDILAFKEDSTFFYWIKVPNSAIEDSQEGINGNLKTVNIHLLRYDENVHLMILANSRSVLNAKSSLLVEGESQANIRKALTYDISVWNYDPSASIYNFPMWGETKTPINTASSEKINVGTIPMLRSVAKIDIGADINGDPALGWGSRFHIKEVYVYRANKEGYTVPTPDYVNNTAVTNPTLVEGTDKVTLNYTYKVDPTENAMINTIYVSESAACEGGKETESTCLVVGAEFDGGDITYYRVDLMDKDNNYLPILRNYRYLINITSIKGEGYSTPGEAANSKSSSLSYNLKIEDTTINDIVYNNEYALGVSDSVIYIDWYDGATTELNIYTSYTKWQAKVESETSTSHLDWLELSEYTGNEGTETITLTTKYQNIEQLYRNAYITFTAGSLTKVVHVKQRMGSNCYIVPANNSIQLPVAMVNASGITQLNQEEIITAKVLWSDNAGVINGEPTVSGQSLYSRISVNTGVAGNAIVGAIYNNEVIWSWHIWVTDHKPEAKANLRVNNGYTFMDRNLGATATSGAGAYGMVYQWGRKDPFPATGYVNTAEVIENDNLKTSIENPTIFYLGTPSSGNDWYGLSNYDNFRWIDKEGNKTIFDPCPDGWRVPESGPDSMSPWYGLTQSVTNGDNAAGYYPLAGGRLYDSGESFDTGQRGYIWSASPYGFNALLFRYGSVAGSVSTSASSYRANAYPVRCVKEDR